MLADGDNLTYQWKKDSVDIVGATSSTLTLLGAAVAIKQGRKGKGTLSIAYSSLEQLDGILERLGYHR